MYIRNLGAGRVFTLLHGQGIKERLECGTHLTACLSDMVVFEKAVVQTAYVGFHVSSVRLYGNEAGLQEPLVVADGIHGRHDRVDGAVPRENIHSNRALEISLNGIHGHACVFETAIAVGALHRGFQDVVDFIGSEVGERRIFLSLPMFVEHRLQFLAHKFLDGFFGITLHA